MISYKDFRGQKGGLWILIIAAVVLETTAFLQYFYSEHVIQVAAEQIVQSELDNIDLQVDAIADSTDNVQLDYIVTLMRQYPNCSYTLTDRYGNLLLAPPDTIEGDKYHTFRQEVGTQGWQMSVLIPDTDLYGRLRRVGMVVTLLMIIGLVLLIFIIFRSAKNILSLINIQESKQRIESELFIASNIQKSMLPKTFPPYPNREDLNMYGIIIPAKEVGGDLYDFYIRDNRLLFCLGDVSGKGVPASLVMAVTRSLFRTVSAHENDAAKIICAMNEAMSEMNEQNMFVTLFLGVLDLKSGRLEYCNAGHNAPLKIGKSDTPPTSDLRLPVAPNIPLGILAGYKFEAQQTTLSAGDSLFLYTDGLTEAENEQHQLFGEERMIQAAAQWKSEQTSEQRIKAIQHEVQTFVGNADQSDDLTMLSVIWIPVEEKEKTNNEATVPDAPPSTYHLTMRNDIRTIPTLAEWVETLPVPPELNMTINLALEEAVSNVMLYAYPEGTAGAVELTAALRNEKEIVFTIEDSGKAFDPTLQEEPDLTLSAEERPIGGLGIHLLRQIMDEIRYERKDNKNILTLIKQI